MEVSIAFRLRLFHVGISDDARVLPLGSYQAVSASSDRRSKTATKHPIKAAKERLTRESS
jgi:hypothetical protein